MANIACPTPKQCGASWHRPYSPAARACSLHATSRLPSGVVPPPAPAGPTGPAALASVAADVRALLAQADAASGWSRRDRRAHPTGGYLTRTVRTIEPGPGRERFGAAVRVSHLDADGALHRGDGPAVLEHAEDGEVALASWVERGHPHRGDGPSVERYAQPAAYAWRGQTLHHDEGRSFDHVELSLQRLVDAGADRSTVVGWLACENLGSYRLGNGDRTQVLIGAGVGPDTVIECWNAGLYDTTAIISVHRGAPMSWAGAGL